MNETLEKLLREINKGVIPRLPEWLFNILSEPYIAGHRRHDALDAVESFANMGRLSSLDILGEGAENPKQAIMYFKEYKDLIDDLANRFPLENRSISLKPSEIMFFEKFDYPVFEDIKLNERLEELVDYAEKKGVNITLDMENHDFTTISLRAAKYVWDRGHRNFGIVLQSMLDRTRQDIVNLFYEEDYAKLAKVRAVIGIYPESSVIATTSKNKAKDRLFHRVKELFEAGVYVQIATHDRKIIRKIIKEVIEPMGISNEMFEFQFLKGVENAYKMDRKLIKEGYKVRYYLPYEIKPGDGRKYMERRLIANPVMVLYAAKNIAQKYLGSLIPNEIHNI